jgi:hypothetical protein
MSKRVYTKNPFDTLRKVAKKLPEKTQVEVKEPEWIPVQLTTLNTVTNSTITLIRLGANERLTINGKCHIACIVGAVEILGFELVGKDVEGTRFYPFYSPSSHSLLSIIPSEKREKVSGSGNATVKEIETINTLLSNWSNESSTIIAIKPLMDQLEGIEQVMPVFKSIFGINTNPGLPQYISVSLEENYTIFNMRQQLQVKQMINEKCNFY